jgi:hypothetical protein
MKGGRQMFSSTVFNWKTMTIAFINSLLLQNKYVYLLPPLEMAC